MRRTIAVAIALLFAVSASPPASAAVGRDCPDPYPVNKLREGQAATGLTVSKGTRPDLFSAEVIGVLRNAIAPDIDLIVVETDSAAIRKVGGIWAGMSGSPVYSEDGRLLGAVAYSLSAGPSRVAGITPAAAMYEVLSFGSRSRESAAPARRAEVPEEMRDRMVESGAASREQADSGLERLPVPMGVSGLTSARLKSFNKEVAERNFAETVAFAASSASPSKTARASAVDPGGNFAAALSVGDLTVGGVGTTTAICRGRALAFGHPFQFSGPTALRAHLADALYIQEDSLFGPYKVANVTGLVGTVDQDRLAAIGADLGATPPGATIRSRVSSTGTGLSRNGLTQSTDIGLVAPIAAFHLLANLDRTVQKIGEGNSVVTFTARGDSSEGPWELRRQNRFGNSFDISFESIFEMLFQLDQIQFNPFTDVSFDEVSIQATVDEPLRQYVLDKVFAKVGGDYVKIRPGGRIPAKAGKTLEIRAVLEPYAGRGTRQTVDLSFPVRAGLAGSEAGLSVAGGSGEFEEFDHDQPASFDDLLTSLEDAPRNDQVTGRFSAFSEDEGGDGFEVVRTERLDQVATGSQFFTVEVS